MTDCTFSTERRTKLEALEAVSDSGIIWIDEGTVESICQLLIGQRLSNGTRVEVHFDKNGETTTGSSRFKPAMLPVQVQDQIRDRLALGESSKAAVRLFNTSLRLDLNIALIGDGASSPHIIAEV